MVEPIPFTAPRLNEQTIIVPPAHNTLVARLSNHTFVSICLDGREIAGNRTPAPMVDFSVSPGTYQVRSGGQIESVTSEAVQRPPSLFDLAVQGKLASLQLTSDAPDRHIVDGIGEIPVDGNSFTTITVQKVDMRGNSLTGDEHNEELFLRTTGGLLMDKQGQSRIRSMRLVSGRAAFRLVSEKNPKFITVSIFSQEPLLPSAQIQIEFV